MREQRYEEFIPPHGPIQYSMNGKRIPVGYKIGYGGVQIRHNTRTHQGWKDITSTPCVLSDLLDPSPDGSCRMVEISFVDTVDVLRKITVQTKDAFDSKISRILREEGAACTGADGSRLAAYFRACYDLRMEEARAAGCV